MKSSRLRRIFRILVTLYPRSFRSKYFSEMDRLLEEEMQETPGSGWKTGVSILLDTLRHLPLSHIRSLRHPRRTPKEKKMAWTDDFVPALRTLLRHPAYSLTIILILALGIGANSAIFSLLDAVLLRPAPGVSQPERLVSLVKEDGRAFSYLDYRDLREAGIFEELSAGRRIELHLSEPQGNHRLDGELVTANYFSTLGAVPARGRFFSTQEDEDSPASRVAVISYRLWQNLFGADGALGRSILINENPYTVIGIASKGFRGTDLQSPPDLWVPMMRLPDFLMGMAGQALEQRGFNMFSIWGRLQPGRTLAQSRQRLQAAAADMDRIHPWPRGARQYRLDSLQYSAVPQRHREDVIRQGALLAAVAALVLAIACLNLANLVSLRAARRRRELALRSALGAGRTRLIGSLMMETALLAFTGGVLGLLMTYWSLPLLSSLQLPAALHPDLAVDLRVAGFGLLLTALTGLLFGLLPAWRASRPALMDTLKLGRGVERGSRIEPQRWIVVAQIALSVVLLTASGLLLRSLWNLSSVDLGFNPSRVLIAGFDLDLQGYDSRRGRLFMERLVKDLQAQPDVRTVSLSDDLPASGLLSKRRPVVFEGRENDPPISGIRQSVVSAGYFDTLEIPVLRGRGFDERDREASAPVAMVSQSLAERFWPGLDPIGQKVGLMGLEQWSEVVGVVRDHRHAGVREDTLGHVYWPLAQHYHSSLLESTRYLLLSCRSDPALLMPVVRDQMQALDPHLPLFEVGTLSERLYDGLAQERQSSAVLGAFAVLAVLLATFGLYSVTASAARRREHEIGVRMALGARPQDVLRLVFWQALLLVGLGLAAGLAGAFAAGRQLAHLLFGVQAFDPQTFAAVSVLLAAVTSAAVLLPAKGAARVDPVKTLKAE